MEYAGSYREKQIPRAPIKPWKRGSYNPPWYSSIQSSLTTKHVNRDWVQVGALTMEQGDRIPYLFANWTKSNTVKLNPLDRVPSVWQQNTILWIVTADQVMWKHLQATRTQPVHVEGDLIVPQLSALWLLTSRKVRLFFARFLETLKTSPSLTSKRHSW